MTAAKAGAQVCLITRSPAEPDLADEFSTFRRLGGRTVFVENLHAKAIMWFGATRRDKAAFIGSHNFTRSSEFHSIELGLSVIGDGPAENLLYRDLKTFVEGLTASYRTHKPQHHYSRCRHLRAHRTSN
jgi:hypothetical protein